MALGHIVQILALVPFGGATWIGTFFAFRVHAQMIARMNAKKAGDAPYDIWGLPIGARGRYRFYRRGYFSRAYIAALGHDELTRRMRRIRIVMFAIATPAGLLFVFGSRLF